MGTTSERLARGEVSAVDAVSAVLDEAFGQDGPVGPLHGLPVTVKDWIDVEGFPCAGAGHTPTAGLVPTIGHFPRVGARSDGRTQIGPLAPAVVVPAGRDDGGMPCSVQVTGRPSEDHVVLAVARRLEAG